MSGGSYDYLYSKVEDAAHQIARSDGMTGYSRPALRRAFSAHLLKVSAAMRAVEWNDSCDGDERESELIEAVLGPLAELSQLIADGNAARDSLVAALERASK